MEWVNAEHPVLFTPTYKLVGILLRPQQLKQAFADYGRGQIGEADLKTAQDAAIRDVVAKQAAHNLPVVVDGEFRRTSFMESFAVVAGVEEWQAGARTYHEILARKDDGKEVTHKGQDPILLNRKRVTAPLKLIRNALADDFRFAQSLTDRPVKVTLIGPDRIQQCYDSEASKAVYPSTNEFLQDVVKVERQMLSELTQAGCRYVGIDGPGYTAYVDADSIAAMRARGEEPMATMERSIRTDNEVIANFPLQARCDLANNAMVRWGALLYQATPEGALPNLAPTGQILLSMPWSRRRHAAYGLSDVDARVLAAWVRGRLAELPRSAQVLLFGVGERRWFLARDYAPATAEGFASWWRECMQMTPDSWLAAVTVAGLQRGHRGT